jgi:hypothetical protein
MKTAPHPPDSPDFAPSDFHLFSYVKECLARLSFESADEFLEAVLGVLESIEQKDVVGALSRVDGPIEEMYGYQ